MAERSMHQTTVRFSVDLWEDLEDEAHRVGVSVAQFVREAALARLMYAAGRRGDALIGRSLEDAASAAAGARPSDAPTGSSGTQQQASSRGVAADVVRERAEDHIESSTALWAQGARARARAKELRQQGDGRRTETAPTRVKPRKPPGDRQPSRSDSPTRGA